MALNQIHFQHCKSVPEFLSSFGAETQCAEAAKAARPPNRFRCLRCGLAGHCVVGHGPRKLFLGSGCLHQISLTAGSLMKQTRHPVRAVAADVEATMGAPAEVMMQRDRHVEPGGPGGPGGPGAYPSAEKNQGDHSTINPLGSILVAANQPFSGWTEFFPDPGMTVAAIDRLVHHPTIFELHNVDNYRGKVAGRDQKNQSEAQKTSRWRQPSSDNDKHAHPD
jgi:hypothetical protein